MSDQHTSGALLPSKDPNLALQISCAHTCAHSPFSVRVCVCVLICWVESSWWMRCLALQKSLQQQQQRMPDRRGIWCIICLTQSVCYPSSNTKLRPHRLFFFFFPENPSVQSICFGITAKGFPEKPNLKWSKGYRFDCAAQSTNEAGFSQAGSRDSLGMGPH